MFIKLSLPLYIDRQKIMINRFLQNWKSGLTIALVSLPIAISLTIGSHAMPTAISFFLRRQEEQKVVLF